MASPVPKPDARKQRHAVAAHNATRLPVTGRVGRPPKCPVDLDVAGQRWWRWAWTTPQATQWNRGFMEPLARRAALEDEYAGLTDQGERQRLLSILVRIDDGFGLTPRSAAGMHLSFVDEPQAPKAVEDVKVTPIRPRLKGMRE